MKQTHNALKMLLSHYRAIYKNALIAMLCISPLINVSYANNKYFSDIQNGVLENGVSYTSKDSLVELKQDLVQSSLSNTSFGISNNSPYTLKANSLSINGTLNIKTNATGTGGDNAITLDLDNGRSVRGLFTGGSTGTLKLVDTGSLKLKNTIFDINSFKTIDVETKASNGEYAYIHILDNTDVLASSDKLKEIFTPKSTTTQQNGKLILSLDDRSSALYLTDKKEVLLDNLFSFNSKVDLKDGSIYADHAFINDKINLNNSKGQIVINKFRLGEGTALNDGLGVKTVIRDELNLPSSFTLKDDMILDTYFNHGYKDEGSINGPLNTTLSVDNNSKLVINGGQWLSNVNLKINSCTNNCTEGVLVLDGSLYKDKETSLSFAPNTTLDLGKKAKVEIKHASLNILDNTLIKNNQDSAIEIKDYGTLNIGSEALKKLLATSDKVKLLSDSSKIVLVGDTSLNLEGDTYKDILSKQYMVGSLKGESLNITKINYIQPNDTDFTFRLEQDTSLTKDIYGSVDFNNILFQLEKKTSDGKDIANKVIVRKANLKVGSDICVTDNTSLGELVLDINTKDTRGSNLILDGDVGTLSLAKITVKDKSSILVNKGTWSFTEPLSSIDLQNGSISLNKDTELISTNTLYSSQNSNIYAGSNANLSFAKLEVLDGTLTVKGEGLGALTITGTKDSGDIILKGNLDIKDGGYVVIGRDAASDLFNLKDGTLNNGNEIILDKIKSNGAGTLKFDLDSSTVFAGHDLIALKYALSGATDKFTGFINIGDAQIKGSFVKPDPSTGHYHWIVPAGAAPGSIGVSELANLQFTNNALENEVIEMTKADAASGVMGSFGSFYESGSDKTTFKGNTSLNNAEANQGFFISNLKDDKTLEAGSVCVNPSLSLSLNNGGSIKDVTLLKDSSLYIVNKENSTTTLNSLDGENGTASFTQGKVIANNIKTQSLDLNNVDLAVSNTIKTDKLKAKDSKTIVDNLSLVTASLENSSLTVDKDFNLQGELNLNTSNLTVNGKLKSNSTLNLGDKESSASLFVDNSDLFTGSLNIKGLNDNVSLAVFGTGAIQENKLATYNLAHDAILKDNAIIAFGFTSFKDALFELNKTDFYANNKLDGNVKAVAFFNAPLKISDKTLSLNSNVLLNTNNNEALILGNGSILAFTDSAFEDLDGNKSKDIYAFSTDKANQEIIIEANSLIRPKVVLSGNFTVANSKGLKVFDNFTLIDKGDLTNLYPTLVVESVNGLVKGLLNSRGEIVDIRLDKSALSKLEVSNPVKEYIALFALNENFTKDKALKNLDDLAHKVAMSPTGISLEHAARFAVYGGALKASSLASSMLTDALYSYVDKNDNVALVKTDNSSFFVVPSYKDSQLDNLSVEGLNYGLDLNLKGVTFGSDFSLAPNLNLGLLYSVGTGESKGESYAQGFESDLDYLGGGLFLKYSLDKLNFVSDLSFTKIDTDASVDTRGVKGFDKLSASIKSKALSLGFKGSYDLSFNSFLVKPYAGLRYTKYDIDDYIVKVDNNDLLTNTYDSLNLVSLPLGVELSHDLNLNEWLITPSLDLGAQFNLGSSSLTHYAQAVTKVDGVSLESEVLDDFVFKVKGALKANYKDLNIALSLGYDLGSSTKDLSLQGSLQYLF